MTKIPEPGDFTVYYLKTDYHFRNVSLTSARGEIEESVLDAACDSYVDSPEGKSWQAALYPTTEE